MIDRMVCAKGRDDFISEYDSDEVVSSIQLINGDSPHLSVIFPRWHDGGRASHALANRLAEQGAVMQLGFHDRIIEPNVKRVLKSYSHMKDRVIAELDKVRDTIGYESIHFTGISLGNVAMTLVASEYSDFDSATMVTAGSNLATCLWDGLRTQNISREFSYQGITRQHLDEAWAGLAPITHTPAFENKPVDAVVAMHDKIIPTESQMDMVDELTDCGADITKRFARFGHVITVTSFCIKG